MLSSSTASAPARAASATWSSASHSISTMRPGHSARARATASVIVVPARWLSLTSTASESPMRWLVPPPARTAAFSRRRRPGQGLARIEHLGGRVGLVRRRRRSAPSAWRSPERWPRKLSAVRSAVRIGRSGPVTSSTVSPGLSSSPSAACQASSSPGPTRRKASSAQARPARTPRWRGPQRVARRRRVRHQRRRQVALGPEVLGQRAGHRVGDRAGGTPRRRVPVPRPCRGRSARSSSRPRRPHGGAEHQPAAPSAGRCRGTRAARARRGSRSARPPTPTTRRPPGAGWPARRRAPSRPGRPGASATSSHHDAGAAEGLGAAHDAGAAGHVPAAGRRAAW